MEEVKAAAAEIWKTSDHYKGSKSTVMKQGGRKRKATPDVVEDKQYMDILKYRSKISEMLAMPTGDYS